MNIKFTSTIRKNRLGKCPVKDEKTLQKEPRGSFDVKTQSSGENNIVCRWNDNNIVSMFSNSTSVEPIGFVSRYSVEEKKKILISQPNIVKVYNLHMGGVDRMDQNLSQLRMRIRGKKGWYPLFSYMIELGRQNAWQIYRLRGGENDYLNFT